ncbi:hypothetical protein BJ170DRAFT_736431 [Xylariales sp. AK1849]|nr:hypothetical protein BJ170DRAFT_736431 [Xylariales sp. AK1849]
MIFLRGHLEPYLQVLYQNARVLRRRTTKSAFSLILVCLLLFSIFSGLYLYYPTDFQRDAPQYVSNSNFTAQAITCGFPASSQYGLAGTTLYILLLSATFFVRRVRWLSAAMAASVMTYSGIAAVHLVVLFVYNNRLGEDKQRNYCTRFSTGPGNQTISICHGVHDPDYIMAGSIVGEGLLAILPIATWSSTFKGASAHLILVLWTALLAIGHIFFNIVTPNPYLNYQICSSGFSEPLPAWNYQAVPEDAIWHGQFDGILRNDSSRPPMCIYSCFGPTKLYLGRRASEVGVYEASLSNRYTSATRRGLGVAFWSLYAVLSVAVLILRRRGCGHEFWRQIGWKLRRLSWFQRPSPLFVCRACLTSTIIQALSVCSYLGYAGLCFEEFLHIPNGEPFSAVGQWAAVTTVAMVLIATGASKISKEMMLVQEMGLRDSDTEREWDCEFGYGS